MYIVVVDVSYIFIFLVKVETYRVKDWSGLNNLDILMEDDSLTMITLFKSYRTDKKIILGPNKKLYAEYIQTDILYIYIYIYVNVPTVYKTS